MKKRITSLFLVVALAMTLTSTAFAASTGTATNSKNTTITGYDGSTATFTDIGGNKTEDKVTVKYTGSSLKAGEQYLVLMLSDPKADPENPNSSENVVPTAGNILYIDQKAADTNGSISFEVYPKSLSTGIILIIGVGADGQPQKLIAAIVKASFILGDVDGDGAVSVTDAAQVLRYAAYMDVTDFNEAAADVDGETGISVSDAAMILRVAAKLDSFS